jgi:uncharacterized protein (TIGR03067 family)
MGYRVFLAMAALTLIHTGARGGENENEDLAQDRKQMQGSWSVVAYDQDGKELPAEILKKMSVTVNADTITIKPRVVAQRTLTPKDGKAQAEVKFAVEEGKTDETKYRLDVAKKRKVIELTQDVGPGEPQKVRGLYALEGDRLTLCIPLAESKLPKKIPGSPAAGLVRMVLKRADSKPAAPTPDGK